MSARAYRITAGLVITLVIAAATPAPSTEPPATEPNHSQTALPAPAQLRPQVEFWKSIFATYGKHQVVVHDALYLDRVYTVLDFGPLAQAGASDAESELLRRRGAENEIAKVRAILTRLHQLGPNPQELSTEERKIWALFRQVKERDRFLKAAAPERVRTQTGLRERFARGLEVGARYWPEIERIFREEGVPRELTRLPLVESCFDVRAYSKAGAAGVWQFMPTTGRRFMRIDDAVDERRDPVIAARAAARYLRADFEALGSWPLAITAYNHGRAGIARAVRTVNSPDIADVVRKYHGPAFKFASRNFYAEFLAALEVERNAAGYFGDLNYEPPLAVASVRVPDYVKLHTLAGCAGGSVATLADLNPALSREVVEGKLSVPRGYMLRIPAGSQARFEQQYAALPPQLKSAGQAKTYVVHRVQRGQTLLAIARQYGTTVAAIQKRNKLGRSAVIRAGQALQIPRG